MAEVPKYEITQQVKRILVRHAVNLVKLRFACTQHSVHFLGRLVKDPKGDFDAKGIESLFNDISRLPYGLRLIFDLDNWNVAYDYGSWNVSKRQKAGVRYRRSDDAYVIDKEHVDDLENIVLELEDD